MKALLFLLLLVPSQVYANIIISEIMYDVPGTDSDREWFEVYNLGGDTDITAWTFFEGGSNHKIAEYQGDSLLQKHEYAVVADSPEKFLADYPDYMGKLFDSSWSSLKNSGENLTLRDNEGIDQFSVTYTSEWGASGDGNSLQDVDGAYIAAEPTPGGENTTKKAAAQQTEEESERSGGVPVFQEPDPIYVRIVGQQEAVAGADGKFSADVRGKLGEPLSGARLLWNFGDGKIIEGESVLHHFRYPGSYVVVVSAAHTETSKYSAIDRMTVRAVPAKFAVTEVTEFFVEIQNRDKREIDISFWIIRSGEEEFMIPEHTKILPGTSIKFSSEITGLSVSNKLDVALLYPNRKEVTRYFEVPIAEPEIKERPPAVPEQSPVVLQQSSREVHERSVEEEEIATSTHVVLTKQAHTPLNIKIYGLFGTILLAAAGASVLVYARRKEALIDAK